ncbi:hypothetical protein [Actinoplanes ianthinogenes]|nr:hypothetical protein [Actinoplanes ianthinogenes]
MAAGILAVLCLGGVGVIVSVYDNATEIKRSNPSVVMANFISAYLARRNDEEASLYICKEGGDLKDLNAFRAKIEEAERNNSVKIVVSWRDLSVQSSGDHATATVTIVRSVDNGSAESFDSWRFELVDEDGWRVCSAVAT